MVCGTTDQVAGILAERLVRTFGHEWQKIVERRGSRILAGGKYRAITETFERES